MKILFRVSSASVSSSDRQELIAERVHALEPAFRHIPHHAADARVTRGETRAGEFFEKFVELLRAPSSE